jgi:hypothetical protein
MSINEILKDFSNPSSEFRGKPFWAWNGRLEPEELRKQIRIMKKMGLGGFFMHARVGLDTAYLSDEWFTCVDTCIDEAQKQNMEAWLYDEDRWPSGAAGGLVTKNPEYRMRHIHIDIVKPDSGLLKGNDILAAFTATITGSSASGVRKIVPPLSGIQLKAGESIILFRSVVSECHSWYNGYTYLDTMNSDAVQQFIKVTHEEYKKRCGRHFGALVPGIFTDEPNFIAHWSAIATVFPWTNKLPETFTKRYGYDIINHLMEIFFDVDGITTPQARYHYMDCITFMFTDAFSKQIGEWCEKNKLQFTGHCLGEETLSSQTGVVGSAMRFYEYQQAPGMDILTQYSREYDTAKQVSSVAHQFGRKWRLTETYGCTGWDFPFAGHKAIGDWQAALGINLRAQHLAWYTMEGEAKRDYPAAIFYQSPWWELYPHVENYYSRINAVTTKGQEVRDILVIHPVESEWFKVKYAWNKNSDSLILDTMIQDLRDSLLGANLDFDYGEEEILSRHGRIETRNGDPIFAVNKAAYKAVVVPSVATLRSSTINLLAQFADAGGSVIFAGPAPHMVDGTGSQQAIDLARRCINAPANGVRLAAAIPGAARRLSITNNAGEEINGLLYLLTQNSDAYQLFVCNTGHDFKSVPQNRLEDSHVSQRTFAIASAFIKGFRDCSGVPIELDPNSGNIYATNAKQVDGQWVIETSFPALGSRLFIIPKAKQDARYPLRQALVPVRSTALAKKKWDIRPSEDNVVVLDRPYYTIGNGKEQKPDEILRIDNKARDALGLKHRGGEMVQPWAQEKKQNPASLQITLRYSIAVDVVPSGRACIAVEHPDRMQISINGHLIDTETESGWWTDKSLRTISFDPSLLRRGQNSIEMKCNYDQNYAGLEIAYLLGNFGVKVKGTAITITKPATALSIGDLGKQGLPFYGGSIAYVSPIKPKLGKGERLFVTVPEYLGTAVRILVDGKPAGIIGWQPNEVDITDHVKAGKESLLSIEVIGHRRNSHGPHHITDNFPHWTGPGQFKCEGKQWREDYNLVPVGLMKNPALEIRRKK